MEKQHHSPVTKPSELGRFADGTEESLRREMSASSKEELHKNMRNARVAMKEENKEQSALFKRRMKAEERKKREGASPKKKELRESERAYLRAGGDAAHASAPSPRRRPSKDPKGPPSGIVDAPPPRRNKKAGPGPPP